MGVACKSCGKPLYLRDAKPAGEGVMLATCPFCYTEHRLRRGASAASPTAKPTPAAAAPSPAPLAFADEPDAAAATPRPAKKKRKKAARRPAEGRPAPAPSAFDEDLAAIGEESAVSQRTLRAIVWAASAIIVTIGGAVIYLMLQAYPF